MKRKKPEDTRYPATVSVVAPAFNEQENLEVLCDEIRRVLEEDYPELEILIIDNGSTDQSLAILKRLRSQDDRIGFVSLSRKFGHQGGLIAGLEHSSGDVIVTMDADLQHPPEVIPKLLDHWKNGSDVVGTIRAESPNTPRLRRLLNLIFYAMIRRMMGTQSPASHSDFRLMDRRALDVLLALPEKDKFLRGLTSWIGFRQTTVPYAPRVRSAGKSKFAAKHLVAFTLNGITAFSVLPLRVFTAIGLLVATGAVFYSLFILVSALAYGTGFLPPGWATLAVAVSFLGGVQLIGIGILGEYLGRTLGEVRSRPTYIVSEASTGREKSSP